MRGIIQDEAWSLAARLLSAGITPSVHNSTSKHLYSSRQSLSPCPAPKTPLISAQVLHHRPPAPPPLTPLQAEEDAARRLNVGRVLPSAALSGTNSRAKHSELIGKPFLRQKVEAASMSLTLAFLTLADSRQQRAMESSLTKRPLSTSQVPSNRPFAP